MWPRSRAAPCVSDFRQRDLAAGGEGAPISALADGLIFEHVPRPLAILNLGGMGNLTLLGERGDLQLLRHRTGRQPARRLRALRCLGREYDPEGSHAARGKPDERLVRRWLEHPFFLRPPPRSTGRETFGAAWVETCLEAGGPDVDLLATAVEFVAASIADSLERWRPWPAARVARRRWGSPPPTAARPHRGTLRLPRGHDGRAGRRPGRPRGARLRGPGRPRGAGDPEQRARGDRSARRVECWGRSAFRRLPAGLGRGRETPGRAFLA